MSQTFFSKLDAYEKANRLGQLASSKGQATVWLKGSKEKHLLPVIKFDKQRNEIVLDSKEDLFNSGTEVLCSFEFRGMNFFSQVVYLKSVGDFCVLHFKNDLFKSEKRSSFRLMTFPIYEVWAEFNLGEAYEGGNVVDFKSRTSQTNLFKNFIKLVEGKDKQEDLSSIRIRVQDLSATGMAIHVGELENKFFIKDCIFKAVNIIFSDETIIIPQVKVVYVVNYISNDKNLKKYKVGLNFPDLPSKIDDILGKKINKLLREIDSNKDFENFQK